MEDGRRGVHPSSPTGIFLASSSLYPNSLTIRLGRDSTEVMRLSSKQRIQAPVVILFAAIVTYASVNGPEPGYTDAPGDIGNCTACHDQNVANDGVGSVRFTGLPSSYQ